MIVVAVLVVVAVVVLVARLSSGRLRQAGNEGKEQHDDAIQREIPFTARNMSWSERLVELKKGREAHT